MTNRIDALLATRAAQGKKSFVAYLTAGDPSLAATAAYCRALADGGAHVIELGIPFSDPIADGPTNQAAAERGLASGTTLPKTLAMVRQLRAEGFTTPLVLYSYANPLHKLGFAQAARDVAAAGIDGVLCVDLPPEEAAPLATPLRAAGVHPIFLASPTTTDARLARLDGEAGGFVYYVSRAGVTGAQAALADGLADGVARVRRAVRHPLMVGFGINTPAQVRDVAAMADGVVVGSAIVSRIAARHADAHGAPTADDVAHVRDFVATLTAALG